jgi:hypothetical protein
MEANDGRDTAFRPAGEGERSAALGLGPVRDDRDEARRAEDGSGGAAARARRPALTRAAAAVSAGHWRPAPGWSRWRVIGLLLLLLAAIMASGPLWWLLGWRIAP